MFNLNIKQLICKHTNKERVLDSGQKIKYYSTNDNIQMYYEDIIECTCYKCNKKQIIKQKRFVY